MDEGASTRSPEPDPPKSDPPYVEGRFSYDELYHYLRDGSYPQGYSKVDKAALRKRAKFFTCEGSDLYYVGGPSSKLLRMLACAYTACEYYNAFIV